MINTLQSTAVIRALIGLVQGAALFLLYDAVTQKVWPATDGEIFAPLLAVALFVPMIVVAALDNMRMRTLALWAIAATIVCAGLAFHDIFRSPLEAYGGGLRPVPSPQFFIALAAGLFISHSLIAASEAEHRWIASYPRYFDVSWKQGVQLVLAIVFVGVFWGLLWLGAELFRLIKIETLSELITKRWFAIPVTTLAITCALHVTDVRAGLVSGARTLKLTLLSWLLPMMAAFAVAFLLALPFTSLEPLWSTRRATSILLIAVAALVFLINAAYQDGRPETPVAAVLRVSRLVASLVIVPLVVLAAYGLSLRVRQYGWTPERITAAACVVVAACYAIGYAVVTLLSRGSLRGLEAVNVATAFVIVGVLLALFSPVADPIRISVNDQVSRLEAGRLPTEQFDFSFLRFKAGRYGLAALDRLKSRQGGAEAALIAQKATEALALQRSVPGMPPSVPVTAQKRSANIAVIYPKDQQSLPDGFLQKDWSTMASPWLLPQCLLHDVKCEAMLLDLDGDGAAEILLLPAQHGISAAFKMQADGSWALLGQLQGWQCAGVREALREGKFETVTPPLREIEVNGNRIRLSTGGCAPVGNPSDRRQACARLTLAAVGGKAHMLRTVSPITDILEQARLAARAVAEFGGHLLHPTVRLGVTGLSRAGKTVFITALLHGLLRGGRFPVFEARASGRIARAVLAPQPDDAVPRFDYERHVRSVAVEREWPASTRQISELRVVIDYQSAGGAMRTLTLDIVDYPGEWLLDLPLLDKSYEQWSAESMAYLRRTTRPPLPSAFLERVAAIDPFAPADEFAAIEAARLFTEHLQARRQAHQTLSMIGPGRFLMPGDLAGSPALTFAPLVLPPGQEPPPGSAWMMMRRRYESYRDAVVRPFFRDHFARLDRQIVLVDVLAALDAGPEAVRDLQDAMVAVLDCFRIGRGGLLSALFAPRVDRILFAATKADQVHHSAHDRLEAILKTMTEAAIARAGNAGAQVDVIALAAVRATREALLRGEGGGLPSIVGTASPGEWSDGRHFDGRTEMAFFPGDLPADKLDGGDFRSIRFRPPALENTDDGIPALPHIRLDRALQFLIGDRLR